MSADAGKSDGGVQVGAADARTFGSLVSEHYTELLAIARRELRRAGGAATIDTRSVLHEAFLRLLQQRQTHWTDRPRFLAAAAGMMRRVLVDHIRQRRAAKRGGGAMLVTLDDGAAAIELRDDTLIALDDALTRLADLAPRLARVVECRYFGGLTEAETAEALGTTERTVRRDWIKARGWLYGVLSEEA